jgi:hypothetical protein
MKSRIYFAFSAGLALTGNWHVAILSFAVVLVSGGMVGDGGASSAFDNAAALDRDVNALRLATPASALPVAWTACRLVIFSVDDFNISRNLLFGSKTTPIISASRRSVFIAFTPT